MRAIKVPVLLCALSLACQLVAARRGPWPSMVANDWDPRYDTSPGRYDADQQPPINMRVNPIEWGQRLGQCLLEAVNNIYAQAPTYPAACCKVKALSGPCGVKPGRLFGSSRPPLWSDVVDRTRVNPSGNWFY